MSISSSRHAGLLYLWAWLLSGLKHYRSVTITTITTSVILLYVKQSKIITRQKGMTYNLLSNYVSLTTSELLVGGLIVVFIIAGVVSKTCTETVISILE